MGGSYEEKKTVPEVLTVAKRARVVLKTTVFSQTDQLRLVNRLFIYCYCFLCFAANDTKNISYLVLHCEKLDQLWVPN